MTSPDGGIPDGQYTFPVNTGETYADGAAWYSDQTESDWRSLIRGPVVSSWNGALEKIILLPLSNLLAWVLGGSPQDWDTLEELRDNLIPALIRLPIKVLVQLIGGIPIVGDAFENALAGWLKDTNTTAVAAGETAESVGTQVNYVQQVIAVQSGMGVWETGPDRTGTPSFAFGLLNLHFHTGSVSVSGGSHSHNITGSTSNATAGGDSHNHSAGSLSASSTSTHTHSASLSIDQMSVPTVNATASYAPWANVVFKTAAERKVITFLAYKSGTVSSFYLDVYKMLPDGSSELLYSSTDLAGDLSTTIGWMQHLMSSRTIVADMGDSYDVQFRVTGSGSVSLAGINMPYPTPLAGFRPYAAGSGRNPSSEAVPATISTATRDTMYTGPTPFVSIGIDVGQTQVPRFFYDDFNRSSFGPRWITYGNIQIYEGRVRHSGGIAEISTTAAMYTQQLLTDTVSVECDVSASSEVAGVGICGTSGLGSAAWLCVNDDGAYIQSGSYSSRTTRATGEGGDGHYRLTYSPTGNVFRAYKNGAEIASWVDSGNVVAHGTGKRWVGVCTRRNLIAASGRIDNFVAMDVTE